MRILFVYFEEIIAAEEAENLFKVGVVIEREFYGLLLCCLVDLYASAKSIQGSSLEISDVNSSLESFGAVDLKLLDVLLGEDLFNDVLYASYREVFLYDSVGEKYHMLFFFKCQKGSCVSAGDFFIAKKLQNLLGKSGQAEHVCDRGAGFAHFL